MKIVRKNKCFMFGLAICLLFTFLSLFFFFINGTAVAHASGDSKNLSRNASVKSAISEIFGDKKVSSIEYLYNYDESADYIYVDFADYGYAVFLSDTLELLEYAAEGSLPYRNTNETKFYGGPTNYL